MVIPRSFSMSPESMTRSTMCWCLAKVPACCRSLSTSVVLPWSTWAMMAMLRSGRGMEGPRLRSGSRRLRSKSQEIQHFSRPERQWRDITPRLHHAPVPSRAGWLRLASAVPGNGSARRRGRGARMLRCAPFRSFPPLKLALKIDVDTYRGTREGVPRLVEMLKAHGAGATFLFSLGPTTPGAPSRASSARGSSARWGAPPSSRTTASGPCSTGRCCPGRTSASAARPSCGACATRASRSASTPGTT